MNRRPVIADFDRRKLLRSGLSLGALTMLTGCNLADGDAVDKALWAMSRFNDRVQAWLFDPNRLAPTYPASAITDPFPFNAYFPEDDAPEIDGGDWRLEVSGLVQDKSAWSLARLRSLPQASQITRHICIEGWSAIGQWSGVTVPDLPRAGWERICRRVMSDSNARTVITAASTWRPPLHPQTIIALDFRDKALPEEYGFPIKLRVPTKLGFKNPKWIVAMFVTNDYPGGWWEDQGYNWFSGS